MKTLFSQIKHIATDIYNAITKSFKETSWYNPPAWQRNDAGDGSVQESFRIYLNPNYIAFRENTQGLNWHGHNNALKVNFDRKRYYENRRLERNELLEPLRAPASNVLGESTGYKIDLVTETTAILPTNDSKMLHEYRQAIFERTYLRCKRLEAIFQENLEDLRVQIFSLVEGYYKVDAFEKKLLFGTENACDFIFYEPLEIADRSYFIETFIDHFVRTRINKWPVNVCGGEGDMTYEHSPHLKIILFEAYEALGLPESLFLGDPEGSAVEALEDAAASEVAEAVINEAAASPYGFWVGLTILGVGLAVACLCGRSQNVVELINEIRDL